ncbi:unnamed protein product [Symbiodinium pilosum]|uniref:Uncharacterized protein n=1 Tax=Symbiodinium pilosum TaxID=2952 RepID=A0A812JUQ9_SYMPI|nr:unnamed protein product [Symbiodinium pilosum]
MSWNKDFQFLIFTDQSPSEWSDGAAGAANVQFRHLNASIFLRLATRRTAIEPRLQDGYKLCDWRMAYGEIFATWLRRFHFWGWVDLDVVLGRLAFFGYNASALTDKDVAGEFGWPSQGPLTLLRNCPEVNRLWRRLPDVATRLQHPSIQRLNEWAFGDLLWSAPIARLARPFPTQLSSSSRHNEGDIMWHQGRLWHLPSCGEASYLHFAHWKAAFESQILPTGQAFLLGPHGAIVPSDAAWARLEHCTYEEAEKSRCGQP